MNPAFVQRLVNEAAPGEFRKVDGTKPDPFPPGRRPVFTCPCCGRGANADRAGVESASGELLRCEYCRGFYCARLDGLYWFLTPQPAISRRAKRLRGGLVATLKSDHKPKLPFGPGARLLSDFMRDPRL